MRVNTANRSFFTLAGIVLIPYALLGAFGCGLLSMVVYRLANHGLSGLHRGGEDLRAAAVFFAFVTTGTVIGLISMRRQARATRQLARWVRARSAPLALDVAQAASRAGLAGRVDMVEDPHPCSFTYGVSAPRVALSTGLVGLVGPAELEAVLHHEHYHVRARDTLKMVVARAGASAFFFLPVLRHLRDRYLAGRELAADRHAARAVGERPLAGALYRVVDGPAFTDLGAAAALGGAKFLDQRVEQLEHGREPAMPPLPRWAMVLTVAGLVLLSIALALTLANGGGGDKMAMNDSMRAGGGWGTVTAVLGGLACSVGWALIGMVVLGRGKRHRIAG